MNMQAAVAIKPKRQRDTVRHSRNARTRADFAKLITDAWQSTLEGIFRTGIWLETAKAELPYGEWLLMIKSDLPFGARTAQRLKAISEDDKLTDATHAPHLPVSWMTLYELTKLDDATFAVAIADGLINPKMERKDAVALRPPKPHKPKPKPQRAIGAIDRCAMTVRTTVFGAVDELDADQWDSLIAELRGELDDIEQVIAARRREGST